MLIPIKNIVLKEVSMLSKCFEEFLQMFTSVRTAPLFIKTTDFNEERRGAIFILYNIQNASSSQL